MDEMDEISKKMAAAIDAMLDSTWFRGSTEDNRLRWSGSVLLSSAQARPLHITVDHASVGNKPVVKVGTDDGMYVDESYMQLHASQYELLLILAHLTGSTPPPAG